MKIADWWGRNETFDSERFKSIKGNFSDGGNEKMRKWVNLVLIEFFQIGHNCVGKVFVKTYLKALRDFFPIYGISQYVIFLSNRRRKFKLLGLQGDPRFPVTSLMGTSWSLREENLEGGWSAHFNDSLSKQNFYSM